MERLNRVGWGKRLSASVFITVTKSSLVPSTFLHRTHSTFLHRTPGNEATPRVHDDIIECIMMTSCSLLLTYLEEKNQLVRDQCQDDIQQLWGERNQTSRPEFQSGLLGCCCVITFT